MRNSSLKTAMLVAAVSLAGCITVTPDPSKRYDDRYAPQDYDKSVDTHDVRRCVKNKGDASKYPNCAFRKRDTKDQRERDPFDDRNVPSY